VREILDLSATLYALSNIDKCLCVCARERAGIPKHKTAYFWVVTAYNYNTESNNIKFIKLFRNK
jgi:hypothetical protein